MAQENLGQKDKAEIKPIFIHIENKDLTKKFDSPK